MKLNNGLNIGQEYKVRTREKFSDNEFVDEKITYLGTKVVSGYNKLTQNNTVGYMFETRRGIIILTEGSSFLRGNKHYYFSIYSGYNDDHEYEFLEA